MSVPWPISITALWVGVCSLMCMSVGELAQLLRADGVDAVFVIPVCQIVRERFVELPTIWSQGHSDGGNRVVSTNRRVNAATKNSWVSFPLRRPLGKPLDSDFQVDVIEAALKLLDAPRGRYCRTTRLILNTLRIWNLRLPGELCSRNRDGYQRARLGTEIASLVTWYELGLQRGRTSVGC